MPKKFRFRDGVLSLDLILILQTSCLEYSSDLYPRKNTSTASYATMARLIEDNLAILIQSNLI